MLTPNKCRIDYGEQLIAPEGFELSQAIASTYSLDLNTLLTVPIAMCFGQTLEGPIEQQRIALLDALGQLKNKLTVLYQQGNIKVPDQYNSLYGLLEPSLVPVVPDAGELNSAFSSFHPKVWLIRFTAKDDVERVKYRLIVLSRNLTFDRSWDLATVLDGDLQKPRKAHNKGLLSFFNELVSVSKKQGHQLAIDADELMRVRWHMPEGVNGVEFLSTVLSPNNVRQKPLKFATDGNNRLLVMSPFIRGGKSIAALDWLASQVPNKKCYLFSRGEELNIAGQEALKKWHCFGLNEQVIDGEEMEEMEQSLFSENDLNLHAKLFVMDEFNGNTSWHLGSANATEAAIGSADAKPRNSEFMLKMTGDIKTLGVGFLLKQLTDVSNNGLFVKHSFSNDQVVDPDNENGALRNLSFELINTTWCLEVDLAVNGLFQLIMRTNKLPDLNGFDVVVSTLAFEQFQSISEEITWQNLKLTQVSALVRFDIKKDGEVVDRLVTQLPLIFNCDVNRNKAIVNDLVQTQSQFIHYLSMMLDIQPNKVGLYEPSQSPGSSSEEGNMFQEESVIFEKLMKAAATHPDLLKRIDTLQQQLDPIVIPDDFKSLWRVFSQFVSHD
jgi:hypothetical protein